MHPLWTWEVNSNLAEHILSHSPAISQKHNKILQDSHFLTIPRCPLGDKSFSQPSKHRCQTYWDDVSLLTEETGEITCSLQQSYAGRVNGTTLKGVANLHSRWTLLVKHSMMVAQCLDLMKFELTTKSQLLSSSRVIASAMLSIPVHACVEVDTKEMGWGVRSESRE